MPSAMPPPDENRHPRPCGEPNTTTSTPSSNPSSQPITITSLSNFPNPRTGPQPISAFSSPSSSSSSGDFHLATSTSSLDCWQFADFGDPYNPACDPLAMPEFSTECQGVFSFDWGTPASGFGNVAATWANPSAIGFGELNHAFANLDLGNHASNGVNGNIDPYQNSFNANGNCNMNGSGDLNLNGTNWSPTHSIALLPHMMSSSATNYHASLPPYCRLCNLPTPRDPPAALFTISNITFTNPLHHTIFIQTTSPVSPIYDAGIYLYLSHEDLYFHCHPGPAPSMLPGFATQTYVGRIRNDADPEIWLPTGAGGLGQDWLWCLKDLCMNMRMPPRESVGWREMFREEDWASSAVYLAKMHKLIVGCPGE